MPKEAKAIQILMPINTPRLSDTSRKVYQCIEDGVNADDDCYGVSFQLSKDGQFVRIILGYKSHVPDDTILQHLRSYFAAFERDSGFKIVGRLGRVPNLSTDVDSTTENFVNFTTDPKEGMN